jgi:hypothetical protein
MCVKLSDIILVSDLMNFVTFVVRIFFTVLGVSGKFVFLLSAYTGMLSQGPPGNPVS